MRTTPCHSTKNDIDLLTTRETVHSVVQHGLGLETKVGRMLLDLATNERAKKTEALGRKAY